MTDPFERIASSPLASFALNMVSGAALLAMAAWFTYNITSSREIETPPRIVNSIVVEPTILLPGKPFKTTVNVTLNKLCPYEVHWSLVREDNNLEVAKLVEPVKQPPATLGTQDLPPTIRYIPNSVAPGEYKFISEVYDQCPDGHTYTSVRHNVSLAVR